MQRTTPSSRPPATLPSARPLGPPQPCLQPLRQGDPESLRSLDQQTPWPTHRIRSYLRGAIPLL